MDDFWYRTIILPVCMQPLIDMINTHVKRLHEINRNMALSEISLALRDLTLRYGIDKNHASGRLVLLTVFDDSIYRSITNLLDTLEDDISEFCGNIQLEDANPNRQEEIIAFVENLFWSRLAEIYKEMMSLHLRLQDSVRNFNYGNKASSYRWW